MGLVEVDLPLDLGRDVHGERKVGLADVALDDALAEGLDLADVRPDLERILGVEQRDAAGKAHGGLERGFRHRRDASHRDVRGRGERHMGCDGSGRTRAALQLEPPEAAPTQNMPVLTYTHHNGPTEATDLAAWRG